MSAESSKPFRALVPCVLVVLAATVAASILSRAAPGLLAGGMVAVEVDGGEGPGSVILFEVPPNQCRALSAAGLDSGGCDRSVVLARGTALFRMPDGSLRQGWMSGADLITVGLPVPVNEASSEDLEAIDGVGPALAAAIVTDRAARGPFRSAADLDRVRGIGPSKAAAIDRHVIYSPAPRAAVPPSR